MQLGINLNLVISFVVRGVLGMAEKRKGGFARLAAFILGGAIGAIGGLLFAPRSGKETRERFKERAEEMVEEGRKSYEEQRGRVLELASEKGQELKGRIEEARERLAAGVESASKAVRERIEQVGGKAEETAEKTEEKSEKETEEKTE